MTLKGLFAGLLGLRGANAAVAPAAVDPKSILFTIPTISDDISPQEPAGPIGPQDLAFHEDDWRQLEFYPARRKAEVQSALRALKTFEAANRAISGWRNVYVRHLKPAPVFAPPPGRLDDILGLQPGPAPVLFAGAHTVTGRIAHGFTLLLGPKAWLYGVRDGSGVIVLGAHLAGADDGLLTRAFVALNNSDRLILVDWRQQMLLLDVDSNGQIAVWRP